VPYPAKPMTMWPVSTRVNSPANDDPDLLTPVPDLPGIR
jgi:putative SOS response-associated peptidase YedK